MKRRTRIILFLVFFTIFLVTAPTLILYLQGYRLDWENRTLVQTGGVFLKSSPKQVQIYVNGKLIGKTDFFFGSFLISDLFPQKYQIEIKKEGYFSWKKDFEVKEREVVEARNITLFPQNPQFEILKTEVKDFWYSLNGQKIIFYQLSEKGWALKIYEIQKNLQSHLMEEADINPQGADLMNLEFSDDSKMIYLDIGMKEQERKFVLDLDKVPPLLTEREKEIPPPQNVITYQKVGENIYYLDNFGFLFRADSSFKPQEKLNQLAFSIKQETQYQIKFFPNHIFLQEGKTLYLLNQSSKSFEKFFEGANNLIVSPDNKKLAYFSEREIWLLFLEDKNYQPTKKAGEKLFLIRLSEKIENVFWLNPDYLIFNTGDKIKIVEIDDRDRINNIDLVQFENSEIFFNEADKKLYLLSNEIFYQSSPLLP